MSLHYLGIISKCSKREVTQKGLALSPLFLHVHICPIDMQTPAKFHEIPSMDLQDIKETKVLQTNGRTHRRTM